MKKLEELLNLDLGCRFDTPKKLNRSSQEIPQTIVDSLEAGDFTAEAIQGLTGAGAGKFPIFRYRTCITIHGRWPEVSRTRIGGYKNVHQNQNGSVEIYYSAIDRGKIKRVCNVLRAQQDRKWNYSENSVSRQFFIQRAVTRETLPQVRAELEPIGKKLAELKIYGYINLYVAATPWGQHYLVLSLHPLAIPEEQVSKLIFELTGLNEGGQASALEAQAAEEAKKKAEHDQWYEEYKRKEAERKAEAEKNRAALLPQIAHLEECNDPKRGILVRLRNDDKPGFVFLRYDGAGSFGRLKLSRAHADTFTLEGLQWADAKQRNAQELKTLQGYRLAQANSHTTPRVPKVLAAGASTERKVLSTINY